MRCPKFSYLSLSCRSWFWMSVSKTRMHLSSPVTPTMYRPSLDTIKFEKFAFCCFGGCDSLTFFSGGPSFSSSCSGASGFWWSQLAHKTLAKLPQHVATTTTDYEALTVTCSSGFVQVDVPPLLDCATSVEPHAPKSVQPPGPVSVDSRAARHWYGKVILQLMFVANMHCELTTFSNALPRLVRLA